MPFPPEFDLELRHRLKAILPGESAQKKLSRVQNYSLANLLERNQLHRKSAVMILLWPELETMLGLLIRRPSYPGVHSGQVAFPGGKKEEADSDLLVTAIRETQEEVGVLLKAESVAGALTPLYIPVSNFLVQPFVAILTGRPELQLNKNEVEAVMDFDLRAIIDPGNIREKQMQTSSGMLLTPYYELGGVEVWGATAMIISELAEIVRPLISS